MAGRAKAGRAPPERDYTRVSKKGAIPYHGELDKCRFTGESPYAFRTEADAQALEWRRTDAEEYIFRSITDRADRQRMSYAALQIAQAYLIENKESIFRGELEDVFSGMSVKDMKGFLGNRDVDFREFVEKPEFRAACRTETAGQICKKQAIDWVDAHAAEIDEYVEANYSDFLGGLEKPDDLNYFVRSTIKSISMPEERPGVTPEFQEPKDFISGKYGMLDEMHMALGPRYNFNEIKKSIEEAAGPEEKRAILRALAEKYAPKPKSVCEMAAGASASTSTKKSIHEAASSTHKAAGEPTRDVLRGPAPSESVFEMAAAAPAHDYVEQKGECPYAFIKEEDARTHNWRQMEAGNMYIFRSVVDDWMALSSITAELALAYLTENQDSIFGDFEAGSVNKKYYAIDWLDSHSAEIDAYYIFLNYRDGAHLNKLLL